MNTVIPALPGIYKSNGNINYSMNLNKKFRKLNTNDFEIIKVMPNASLKDLCNEIKMAKNEDENDKEIKLYHYLNKETGYTMISIYDNLNVDGYERIDY